jgi:Flp pilus assembly protein TadG
MLLNLLKDKSGNFGLMTALVAVPLIGAAGMAVDYAKAMSRKHHMQEAADAAVLAAATSGKTNLRDLTAVAQSFYDSNISQRGYGPQNLQLSVDAAKRITVTVSARVPVSLAAVLHPEGIPVTVLSQAEPGQDQTIEVVLVLDTTYSMVGKKLSDLKAASKSMLNLFKKADPSRNRIRIGIVPFSRYVNVGTHNRNQSWITVPADYATTTNSCTTSRPVLSKSNCTTVSKTGYNDGIPYSYTQEQCKTVVYGDPVTTCAPKTNTYSWSGCVDSRKSPSDLLDSADPKYVGLLNTSCGSPITPLTNDYTTLGKAVDAMKANNETYIAPGILWGWSLLSPTVPFDQGAPMDDKTRKIMVVMTDGANTKSPTYPYHNGNDARLADKKMKSVCDNARDAGVTTYTVAVGVTESAALAALASCASDASKALSVDDSAELEEIFGGIATQILTARLTM